MPGPAFKTQHAGHLSSVIQHKLENVSQAFHSKKPNAALPTSTPTSKAFLMCDLSEGGGTPVVWAVY